MHKQIIMIIVSELLLVIMLLIAVLIDVVHQESQSMMGLFLLLASCFLPKENFLGNTYIICLEVTASLKNFTESDVE